MAFVLWAASCQAFAAVALVQEVGDTGGGDPVAVTVSATGTTDTVIVVAVASDTTRTISSVSDGGSNTYTQRATAVGPSNETCWIYTAPSTSSTTTVTVDFNASTAGMIVGVFEFSGADNTTISGNNTVHSSTTDTLTSGVVTAETDGAMVGAVVSAAGTLTFPGAPWTNTDALNNDTMTGYRLVSSGGSINFSPTVSPDRTGASCVVEIGPASAGGATIPIFLDHARRRH